MSVIERVERVAGRLRMAQVGALTLTALGTGLAVVALAALVDRVAALSASARAGVVPLACGAGLMVLWWGRARLRAVPVERAALWIEERHPALRYALVTAVDPHYAGRTPALDALAARVEFERAASPRLWRALRRPAAVVCIAALTLGALPSGIVARVARPRPGDALLHPRSAAGRDPLAAVVVTIAPPAYAEMRSTTREDPASVRALVGSQLTIEGRNGDDAVLATFDSLRVASTADADRWRVRLSMPSAATVLTLRAGVHERLLALEPVADSAPVVTLTTPARDSILRRPTGSIVLHAELSDDHALASGGFEYIVSSGSGESFTFTSGTLGATTFVGANAGRGTLAATLSIDALEMRPGDLVHVRAVARDRNTVSGPTLGVSETRTLRIARADEYDSVAVDAAPPPEPEKNALSQRMLLLMAQALEKRRGSLARAPFVSESRAIALDQTRLRKRVGEIVFQRLGESGGEEGDAVARRLDKPTNPDSVLAAAERATGGNAGAALEGNEDESPVVAVNRPLLEAYNFMWSASTELELGEPGRAVPWMQKALDRLQAARAAERIYLRGKVRAVIVDVAKVRLSGKDKGAGGIRTPRPPADPGRAERLARFDRWLSEVAARPAAVADSLVLLRVELLGRDPAAAQALEVASNAMRRGGDLTPVLITARRAIAGEVERRTGLSWWGAP
jgi:hypothetical protein